MTRRIELPLALAAATLLVAEVLAAGGCAPPVPPDDASLDATVGPDDAAQHADGPGSRDACVPVTEPDGAVSSVLCRRDANCYEMVYPDGASRVVC